MVVSRRHLTDFLVQGVYSAALMKAITKPWKGREYGDLQYRGQAHYLAQLNAHRTVYSAEEPPREPGAGKMIAMRARTWPARL